MSSSAVGRGEDEDVQRFGCTHESDVWRHLVPPVLGLVIGYVIISADVAAQRIGLLWLALGGLVLVAFSATGRPPRLGALDATASGRTRKGQR